MADEAKKRAQLEAGKKKLEAFKQRKLLLKQQQQQQQSTSSSTSTSSVVVVANTAQESFVSAATNNNNNNNEYDDVTNQQQRESEEEEEDKNEVKNEIDSIVREALERELSRQKRKFDEDMNDLSKKQEKEINKIQKMNAEEVTLLLERERVEFEERTNANELEFKRKLEEALTQAENVQKESEQNLTERINELQEKVQKAVKKGKAMQMERDEIKIAFESLTTQSEDLVKTIESSNVKVSNVEKELGETKIALASKEKEFMDLKQFYEENNASNLNEEERLKMELSEATKQIKKEEERANEVKRKFEEIQAKLDMKQSEVDDLKQLFDVTVANSSKGEESLREELNALEEKVRTEQSGMVKANDEKVKMLESELENEVNTRISLETEVEEMRYASAQSSESLRVDFENAKKENEEIKEKCASLEHEINYELKPKCAHLEQELLVAQEEVNGQFQIGIERDEIIQKLAQKEQELNALKAANENQEIKLNSTSDAIEKMHKELGETKIALASKEEELSNGQFQIGIERDEIMQKLARKEEELDALKAVNENQEININSASDAMEKMHKELGETKIAFASREKEFMDLKQFYEENNASNLNEEERLKMELTEMNAKFIKANEKIVQLELDARTVSNERYDLIAQIDQYQKQMDNLEKSFDVHKSDEESLREEKETFLGKINALESEKNELLAVNKTVASELKEMTDLKNAQSEKVQKAVKKGKSIQADLVETKKMLTTKENELSELKQVQLLNASAAAAMTTPALNEEDEKMYKALIAEKDSLIESLREQQMTVSSNLENFQNQMNDLINERNASAESMHIIESELIMSRENISHVEKELGETKIALASREKEFMDLKQFYEENNASNLNEEERLKMELTEANANMKLVREDAEQLKRKLAEQETAVAFANQQHLEQIQILQATIAEARNESAQERDKAEEIKQQLETKMTELQRMKLEIDANAEKLEEINSEKEMFMSECEKALESFDREKAKAKELKQKLKDIDQESKSALSIMIEEHEASLQNAMERTTYLEQELEKANVALASAERVAAETSSFKELEKQKEEQQIELHELKSRLDQELQGMNIMREKLQEERGKRAQLDARLAAVAAQSTAVESTQKQPSPHHRFTNKKNEDYGDDDNEMMLNDIEGAIISGGSYSFVPLQGKFKALTFCPPLQSKSCLQAANMFDRFSVFLQRRPIFRVLLIGYFALLHVMLLLF